MMMEMPTPCNQCGNIFDLHDGKRSQAQPGIIICEDCGTAEEEKVEREEEIQDLRNEISDAEHTIKAAKERLVELGELQDNQLTKTTIWSNA